MPPFRGAYQLMATNKNHKANVQSKDTERKQDIESTF
jgi:hypothetical protein